LFICSRVYSIASSGCSPSSSCNKQVPCDCHFVSPSHNFAGIPSQMIMLVYLKGNSELGSSVSIVSGYGLDGRAIKVRSPAEAKGFFPLASCVQTGSGVHPASCTMGTGGPFPGDKARPGRDTDHSPHLVPRSRMSRSYTPFPLGACMS
jgi:hypothetical protein